VIDQSRTSGNYLKYRQLIKYPIPLKKKSRPSPEVPNPKVHHLILNEEEEKLSEKEIQISENEISEENIYVLKETGFFYISVGSRFQPKLKIYQMVIQEDFYQVFELSKVNGHCSLSINFSDHSEFISKLKKKKLLTSLKVGTPRSLRPMSQHSSSKSIFSP